MTTAITSRQATGDLKREIKLQAIILASYIALLWALELVDSAVFRGGLDGLGIHPRSPAGVWGILAAPFLHGGFGHLAANTAPLAVLAWFVMLRETRHFFIVGAISAVIGGLGIWLFGGAGTVHIGASITIFGFLGYLLFRGWFDRNFASILGSLVVALLYGSLVLGMLPGRPGISWEGHLFGFAGGALAARLLRQRRAPVSR